MEKISLLLALVLITQIGFGYSYFLNKTECEKQTTCKDCFSLEGCGWCAEAQACFDGNEHGPLPSHTCPKSDGWVYGVNSTTEDCKACHSETGCEGCTAVPHCGWCIQGSGICLPGSASSSTGKFCNNDPNMDGWLFDASECDACAGITDCDKCLKKKGCGFCAYYHDTKAKCTEGWSGGALNGCEDAEINWIFNNGTNPDCPSFIAPQTNHIAAIVSGCLVIAVGLGVIIAFAGIVFFFYKQNRQFENEIMTMQSELE